MFDENKRAIGNTGRYARTCPAGTARLRAVQGKLGLKRGPHCYVFVRFSDSTGKIRREELGRFLLSSVEPVAHANGDPLDFAIQNLRQVVRVKRENTAAKPKMTKELNSADVIAAQEQQLVALLPVLYQIAGAILQRHSIQEDTVHELLPSIIGQIRKGTVRNLEHFAKRVVRLHSRRKQAGVLNGSVGDIEHDPAQRALMAHAAKFAPSSNGSLHFTASESGEVCVNQSMSKKRASLSVYDNQQI